MGDGILFTVQELRYTKYYSQAKNYGSLVIRYLAIHRHVRKVTFPAYAPYTLKNPSSLLKLDSFKAAWPEEKHGMTIWNHVQGKLGKFYRIISFWNGQLMEENCWNGTILNLNFLKLKLYYAWVVGLFSAGTCLF